MFPKNPRKTTVLESFFQKNHRIKPAALSKTYLYCYSTINLTTLARYSLVQDQLKTVSESLIPVISTYINMHNLYNNLEVSLR